MPCKKSRCLKQVNPKYPNVYFGIPFEKDENSMACYLCERDNTELQPKPKLIKRIVPIQEPMRRIKREEWQKNPSVRTGGQPYFWTIKTSTGKVWVIWNRLKGKWVVDHETQGILGTFDSNREGKRFVEDNLFEPIKEELVQVHQTTTDGNQRDSYFQPFNILVNTREEEKVNG